MTSKSNGAAAVAVVIVLVAAFALLGPLRSVFSFGAGGPDSISGQVMVQFTVNYKDGSRETFPQSFPTLSILPLTISKDGKPIGSIDIKVLAKISGANAQTWSTRTTQQIAIYRSGESTPKISSSANYSSSGASWKGGDVKTIANYTIPGSVLNALIGSVANMAMIPVTFDVQVNTSTTIQGFFNSGLEVYDADVSGSFKVTYIFSGPQDIPQVTYDATSNAGSFARR